MKDQDKSKPTQVNPEVRSIDDIPAEEKTKQAAGEPPDDVDIDPEAIDALSFEAVTVQWRIARSLLALRQQVNTNAPARSKASDGSIGDPAHQSRASDHNPWVVDGNVGVVTAIDITHDAAHGCDASALAEAIRGSRDPRVKYIIWNKRIASSSPNGAVPSWNWRPYTGANPHNKHIHISVKADKANYDSTGTWTIQA